MRGGGVLFAAAIGKATGGRGGGGGGRAGPRPGVHLPVVAAPHRPGPVQVARRGVLVFRVLGGSGIAILGGGWRRAQWRVMRRSLRRRRRRRQEHEHVQQQQQQQQQRQRTAHRLRSVVYGLSVSPRKAALAFRGWFDLPGFGFVWLASSRESARLARLAHVLPSRHESSPDVPHPCAPGPRPPPLPAGARGPAGGV